MFLEAHNGGGEISGMGARSSTNKPLLHIESLI